VKAEIQPLSQTNDESFQKAKEQFLKTAFIHDDKGFQFPSVITSLKIVKPKFINYLIS
jgi:hypothetical protein